MESYNLSIVFDLSSAYSEELKGPGCLITSSDIEVLAQIMGFAINYVW